MEWIRIVDFYHTCEYLSKLAFDMHTAFNSPKQNYFSCYLFRLIAKADSANQAKLAMSYPEHVALYTLWHAAPAGQVFSAKYAVVA